MEITKEDILKIGHLARLTIKEEEVAGLTADINKIVTFVSQIDALNTEGVPITDNVLNMQNVLREDEIKASMPLEKTQKMAIEFEYSHFKVPRVVG